MRRRQPRSLLALILAGCAVLAPVAIEPARADQRGLIIEAEWPVPSVGSVLPAIVIDSTAQVGYELSLSSAQNGYDRGQVVDARTGRTLSARVAIPALGSASPVVVDTVHHLVMYPEVPPQLLGVTEPTTTNLVGIGLRDGQLRQLFRVPWRVTGETISALAIDSASEDLFVLGSSPGSIAGPHLDRLSLADLQLGTLSPRWNQPYQVPATLCPEVLSSEQPAALMVVGPQLFFGCRPRPAVRGVPVVTTAQSAGVVTLDGVTASPSPAISATLFPAPGYYDLHGESFAEPMTRRLVLEGQGTGAGLLRVFDTAHRRYVGTIKLGNGTPAGITSDPTSGRIYAAGRQPGDLSESDLVPVVPTQGQLNPYSDLVTAAARLAFNSVTHRLFVPHSINNRTFIAVLRDDFPRFTPDPPLDYDAGALDAVDQAGVTDSSRDASAAAYGAQYSLVGGVGGLYRNLTAVDDSTGTFKGTRFLREATVQTAGLSGDASTAQAALATEDNGTDQNRQSVTAAEPTRPPGPLPQASPYYPVDAGSQYAASAACSDFGSTPTKTPMVVLTAQVSCDLARARTAASAVFDSPGGLLMTVPGRPADVPAGVQVGRSTADVTELRAPHRGAVVTTVRATANNITLLGLATIASVSSTVTVSAHGRHGTAVASPPTVVVSGVSVQGAPVCSANCSIEQVAAALNTALGVHGHVDFPTPAVVHTRGGTFASVGQDPWMHAEQVLDYDQDDGDYTVPAMTITLYLEGGIKSRLVVNLAAVSASAIYRVFALTDQPARVAWPAMSHQPVPLPQVGVTLPSPAPVVDLASGTTSKPTTVTDGPLNGLIRALRYGLRSPAAALPLVLAWSLFAFAPYLSARRRLLLELPLLTRELESS